MKEAGDFAQRPVLSSLMLAWQSRSCYLLARVQQPRDTVDGRKPKQPPGMELKPCK